MTGEMIGTPPSTLPLRPEGALCFFDMDKTLIAGNSGVSSAHDLPTKSAATTTTNEMTSVFIAMFPC